MPYSPNLSYKSCFNLDCKLNFRNNLFVGWSALSLESRISIDIYCKVSVVKVAVIQLTITCSKSATETLEKGLKYVQSQ